MKCQRPWHCETCNTCHNCGCEWGTQDWEQCKWLIATTVAGDQLGVFGCFMCRAGCDHAKDLREVEGLWTCNMWPRCKEYPRCTHEELQTTMWLKGPVQGVKYPGALRDGDWANGVPPGYTQRWARPLDLPPSRPPSEMATDDDDGQAPCIIDLTSSPGPDAE